MNWLVFDSCLLFTSHVSTQLHKNKLLNVLYYLCPSEQGKCLSLKCCQVFMSLKPYCPRLSEEGPKYRVEVQKIVCVLSLVYFSLKGETKSAALNQVCLSSWTHGAHGSDSYFLRVLTLLDQVHLKYDQYAPHSVPSTQLIWRQRTDKRGGFGEHIQE